MEVPTIRQQHEEENDNTNNTTNVNNDDEDNSVDTNNGDHAVTVVDPRMILTPAEREWAVQIKSAAIESASELDPMTDYMYAQFSIHSLLQSAEGNNNNPPTLEAVLEQIENYQLYRKEYKIHDTYEDGCTTLEKTIRELLPDHYLSFSYHKLEDAYVVAIDPTAFDRTVTNDPIKFAIHVAAIHYLFHAQQPDFQSLRNGVITLFDMADYNWRHPDMFNITCVKSLADQANICPLHTKSIRFYNTGLFTNLVLSLAKRIVRKTASSTFEVGWTFGGDGSISSGNTKLRDALVVPDRSTANERNLKRLKNSLEKRYNNELSFRLSSS